MSDWTYVGQIQEFKAVAEDVLQAWDSGVGLREAMAKLRHLLMAEKRYSWTEDYYDMFDKGEK